MMDDGDKPAGAGKTSRLPIVLLLGCVLMVSFWQIMAWRARRGFDAFRINARTLADFEPRIKGFELTEVLVKDDPLEPNIISYRAKPRRTEGARSAPPSHTVLIRLAHGYNIVDCMRIKHYQVDPLADVNDLFPHQVWRLTSSINDQSIWMTTMHGSEDFAPLDMDTRDMAFPKIGTPDDPSWNPSGLKLASLRRPLYNLKRTLRARWNSARCDLLTFLRLRRPVYASDEVLSLVSAVILPPANDANPADVEAGLVKLQERVHSEMTRQLVAYRSQGL
ncbi:MAG: hypothetical protein ISS31_04190 [Kiritimatiellae bacterium]|nr:hypothetical protein [Kiritimatiellia bacterium]